MKCLIAAIVFVLVPSQAYSQSGEALHLTFDQVGIQQCRAANFLDHVQLYLVYRNPTLYSIHGFECKINILGAVSLTTTFPVPATNIGTSTNIIVGYQYPVITQEYTLLATADVFCLDSTPVSFFLGPSRPSSSANGMPMIMLPDFSLRDIEIGNTWNPSINGGNSGVEDIPGDQGGKVRLWWKRCNYDAPGRSPEITGYAVFRRQDEFKSRPSASAFDSADKLLGWDHLTSISAFGEEGYQVVVPTLCDSTVADGMCWSVYMVRAMTADQFYFFDSCPDSGYSVDNLAPSVPSGLQVGAVAVLVWDEAMEEDFRYFTVYGSDDVEWNESAVAILQTTTPSASVSGHEYAYFFVTATDFAGNESGAASYAAFSDVPSELPNEFALYPSFPNPMNPQTTITFDLPKQVAVSLRIYDVSGRLVRTQLDGQIVDQGRREVMWNGRDDTGKQVASGVYFYRLEAGEFSETKRMVLVR